MSKYERLNRQTTVNTSDPCRRQDTYRKSDLDNTRSAILFLIFYNFFFVLVLFCPNLLVVAQERTTLYWNDSEDHEESNNNRQILNTSSSNSSIPNKECHLNHQIQNNQKQNQNQNRNQLEVIYIEMYRLPLVGFVFGCSSLIGIVF